MILHADADAFFASVELRDRPDLRIRPMAVATHIVMSANYPARAFGIHGAMRIEDALRSCPELTIMPPRPAHYQSVGADLLELFSRWSRRVEPGSLEEAFCDPGERDPVEAAHGLRTEARERLGLPVSVGVARSRLYAKLASRRAKPDGLVVVDAATEARWRAELTIADTWGIGPRTAERLAELGVETIAGLAGYTEDQLAAHISTTMARRLLGIRDGTDDAAVHLQGPRRSIGASRTLAPATAHAATVLRHLELLTDIALGRLLATQALVSRVSVSVRPLGGDVATERSSLAQAERDPEVLAETARTLFRLASATAGPRPVSLIGVDFGLAGVAASREQDALPLF